jgi:hypothetical protein
MSPESRRVAGILLVVLPTVIFGGVSILSLLISPESGYRKYEDGTLGNLDGQPFDRSLRFAEASVMNLEDHPTVRRLSKKEERELNTNK